jgi:tubulin-specific chaperone E
VFPYVILANFSNLHELSIVVLDSLLVRHANPYYEIQSTCPRITSLDLSRNLFSNFSTIAEICGSLNELRTLRLTGNRFCDIILKPELTDAFQRVEWLALNMCAIAWSECKGLLHYFPNVKHLEMAYNGLSNPAATVRLPESVETLILESNDITSLQCLDYFEGSGCVSSSRP